MNFLCIFIYKLIFFSIILRLAKYHSYIYLLLKLPKYPTWETILYEQNTFLSILKPYPEIKYIKRQIIHKRVYIPVCCRWGPGDAAWKKIEIKVIVHSQRPNQNGELTCKTFVRDDLWSEVCAGKFLWEHQRLSGISNFLERYSKLYYQYVINIIYTNCFI